MLDKRPNPDALLKQITTEDSQKKIGKLKVFFGYAAGVGKTFAMLDAAHTAKKEGIDVVAGYIEPHTRPETLALLEGLEMLKPLNVVHKGITLKEFNLDDAIKRNPELILVDELAHTNAEDCRHRKRYQDIEELLKAGINVYTTVNVQHLESLNDIVASITGVIVRERIPDSVFDRADQVELVDIEPDDLIERLNKGKIYKEKQAKKALDHFFTRENLGALREIAMRRLPDPIQPFQHQRLAVHNIRRTRRAHTVGQRAGCDHRRVGCAQRRADLRDHTVQHGRRAVHNAAVQTVRRVGPQQTPRAGLQLHLGQLRRVAHQRRQRALRSRQDAAAHQCAGAVHSQQGSGGIKVHHHAGRRAPLQRAHDGTQQLAAQLGRVVHADAHPAFQPGADLHDLALAHLAQGLAQPRRQRRHHAGKDDRRDLLRLRPVQRQHVYDFVQELITAQRRVRKQPRRKHQLAVRRIPAKRNIGVADIQCQDHDRTSFQVC